jgi:tetratricopeptide (TPR) repeat protein
MLFNLAQGLGDHNKAIEHVNILLTKTQPNGPAWSDYMMKKCNTLIMAYMKTSDKKYLLDGITEFEKILEFQPNNANVLNNLAYLLADNNEQLEKAVEYAKRAYEAMPNDGNNLDTYAYTLCKTGEYAKAEELLQMTIQIFERNSQEVTWDVYRHLGMAQEGLGKNAEAAASYRQALEIAGERISEIDKEQLNKSIERLLQ